MSPNTRRIAQVVLSSIVVLTSAVLVWTDLTRDTRGSTSGQGSAPLVYYRGDGQLAVQCPGADVACFDVNVDKESVSRPGWKEPSSKPCTYAPPVPPVQVAVIVSSVGLLAALALFVLIVSGPRTPRSDPRS